MEGLSFRSPVVLKLFISVLVYVFHLFTVCFLLTKINEQVSVEAIGILDINHIFKNMLIITVNII